MNIVMFMDYGVLKLNNYANSYFLYYTNYKNNSIIRIMKININSKINGQEVQTTGRIKGNILQYDDIIINMDKHILTRKTQDYKIVLDFDNNKGYIDMGQKNILDLVLKTNIIILKQGYIRIEYILNSNEFHYEVNYEEIIL